MGPDTDFELDVVAFCDHNVLALSCAAERDPKRTAWKSREIARQATQLGGDSPSRVSYVCWIERVPINWRSSCVHRPPGFPSVAVFGLDELLDRTATPPRMDRLVGFLQTTPIADSPPTPLPSDLSHDLLATVGGTPLPMLQSILAQRAKRPLLLHDPKTVVQAERIAGLLARRGVPSARAEVGSSFRISAVDSVLDRVPESARVDITGGTKVRSTRVLLRHVRARGLSTATYVDGRHDMLRSLALEGTVGELPSDVCLEEMLELRGWQVETCQRVMPPVANAIRSACLIDMGRREDVVSAVAEQLARMLADAQVLNRCPPGEAGWVP